MFLGEVLICSVPIYAGTIIGGVAGKKIVRSFTKNSDSLVSFAFDSIGVFVGGSFGFFCGAKIAGFALKALKY